jgi:hypothetical protein
MLGPEDLRKMSRLLRFATDSYSEQTICGCALEMEWGGEGGLK